MATTMESAEALDQPVWDIKKDSFALPSSRRLVRGWDRAPVPAHAPRLCGRKVWKKLSIKGRKIDDVNSEVQEELKKEGTGARKKSRMMGTRENIGNAIWKDSEPDTCVSQNLESAPCGRELDKSIITVTDGQENKTECFHSPSLPVGSMPELHFIPRKRTNTNHVITPKIKMRQTTLDQQAQPLTERVNNSSTPTRRPRKSIRKSLPTGIAENDVEPSSARANSRRSAKFEPLLTDKDTDFGNSIPEASFGDKSRKRKQSQQSVTTTTCHISALELAMEIQDGETHNLGSASTDISGVLASEQILIPESTHTVMTSSLGLGCPGTSSQEAGDDASKADPSSMKLSDKSEGPDEKLSLVDSAGSPISEDNCFVLERKQEIMEKTAPEEQAVIHIQSMEVPEPAEITLDIMDSVEEVIVHSPLLGMHKRISEEQASAATDGTASASHPDILSPLTSEGSGSPESDNVFLHDKDIISVMASPDSVLKQENKENKEQSPILKPESTASTEPALSSSATLVYDHDDTDMLRNFLTRVKANKAARRSPRRKRSLPHSPLRLPLGALDNNLSPSPLRAPGETEISDPSPIRGKKKINALVHEGGDLEPRSIRRSGRTRLPVKEPPAVPSFIPVRRLGQDLDTTITLKRSEEKELAALTRVNTRKNKGTALSALEVLARKAEEKEDPVMRQRLLKEIFDEKMEKGKPGKDKKGGDKKVVTWAEEIAQFQKLTQGKGEAGPDEQDKDRGSTLAGSEEKRSNAVRVGIRSKGGMGGGLNGTPAPKRKMRGAAA